MTTLYNSVPSIASLHACICCLFEMSILDFLSIEKFKHRIRVDTQHSQRYISKESTPEKAVILTAHLPYEGLREWYEARQKCLSQNISCKYVEIFNLFLLEKTGMKIKDNNERIEGRLNRACSEIKKKFVGKNGSSYRKLCQKEMKLAVQLSDLVTIGELEKELWTEKTKNSDLEKRCETLVKELFEAQGAERLANTNLAKADKEINQLREENQNLHKYVEELGQHVSFSNSGKTFTETGVRQQRRKLKELKTNVEKALWFAKTFQLDLQSVTFLDDNGTSHTLSYAGKERRGYKDLPKEEQEKVRNILFIMDKFCIGEAAYHELTMFSPSNDLPKSYLIKQCKDDMKNICHVTRTPGSAQGAQVDFMEELQSVIQRKVCVISFGLDFTNHVYCIQEPSPQLQPAMQDRKGIIFVSNQYILMFTFCRFSKTLLT